MANAQANLDAVSDEDLDEAEPVSRCGYCGDAIDYCQGHGEEERARFGFEPDTEEYDERRNFFETNDMSADGIMSHRAADSGTIVYGDDGRMRGMAFSGGLSPDTRDMAGRRFSPDYSQPDPFGPAPAEGTAAEFTEYLAGVDRRQTRRMAEYGDFDPNLAEQVRARQLLRRSETEFMRIFSESPETEEEFVERLRTGTFQLSENRPDGDDE